MYNEDTIAAIATQRAGGAGARRARFSAVHAARLE